MAAISSVCVNSVAQGRRAHFVEHASRSSKSARGISSSGLPERVSSSEFCSSSTVSVTTVNSKLSAARRGGRVGLADFIGSIKPATRCSALPGDGPTAGSSPNLGKSTNGKTLRWVEEEVEFLGIEESSVRNVSVVRALCEDGSESFVVDLRDSDRPQPVAVTEAIGSQVTMEMVSAAMGGSISEVQVMAAPLYRPKLVWFAKSEDEENKYLDRAVNAALAGAAISYAITKVVTVDHDYWHGWTMFEILKYAPVHNWHAYEDFLKSNPVLAKMMISGVVYSIGDWIGQCVEGKPILEFNRTRLLRSGLVGFCLHGSLSHHYYHVCEFLFPFKGWWVVPLKVAFDQTIWSAIWNSIYFITLGLLRFESPVRIWKDLRSTFFPLLTAGWKLWPFAHLITYGLIPVEQRLLWVDCVEILWVTILSMFANEKSEKRLEAEGNKEAVLMLSSDELGTSKSSEDFQ